MPPKPFRLPVGINCKLFFYFSFPQSTAHSLRNVVGIFKFLNLPLYFLFGLEESSRISISKVARNAELVLLANLLYNWCGPDTFHTTSRACVIDAALLTVIVLLLQRHIGQHLWWISTPIIFFSWALKRVPLKPDRCRLKGFLRGIFLNEGRSEFYKYTHIHARTFNGVASEV